MNSQLLDYETVCMIGSGSFGTCFKVRHRPSGKFYVWKTVKYGTFSKTQKERLVSEVNLMSGLHHPNIVEYKDRIIDKTTATLYIIMEWCPGGDLSLLITKCKKKKLSLDEGFIWRILYQIARALQACHSRLPSGTLLHRDVKPANVFLDSDNNAKLGDFGLARILNNGDCSQTFVGTPYYMSPEVIRGSAYSKKSDVWALGCLVYELCSLSPPFKGTSIEHLAKKIMDGKFPRIPAQYSDALHKTITLMLTSNPTDRPTVDILIQNPIVMSHVIEDTINAKLLLSKSVPLAENNENHSETVDCAMALEPKNSAEINYSADDSFTRQCESKLQELLFKKLENIRRKEVALQLKELEVAERERALEKKEKHIMMINKTQERFLGEARCVQSYHKSKPVPYTKRSSQLYYRPIKDEDSSFSADPGDTSVLPTSAKLINETNKTAEKRVHFDTAPLQRAETDGCLFRNGNMMAYSSTILNTKSSTQTHSDITDYVSINTLPRKFSAYSQNVRHISDKNPENLKSKQIIHYKKASTLPHISRLNYNKENMQSGVPTLKTKKLEKTVDNIITGKFNSVLNFR